MLPPCTQPHPAGGRSPTGPVTPPPTLHVLLAAAPDAPGARALVDEATRRAGVGPLRVMLTGAGLGWRGDEALGRLAADGRARVACCSRSARDHRLGLDDLPPWVGASSLVAWVRALGPGDLLWAAFP
jgi:hypothetical protein